MAHFLVCKVLIMSSQPGKPAGDNVSRGQIKCVRHAQDEAQGVAPEAAVILSLDWVYLGPCL